MATGVPSTFLSENKYDSGFSLELFFSMCQIQDLQFAFLLSLSLSLLVGNIIYT